MHDSIIHIDIDDDDIDVYYVLEHFEDEIPIRITDIEENSIHIPGNRHVLSTNVMNELSSKINIHDDPITHYVLDTTVTKRLSPIVHVCKGLVQSAKRKVVSEEDVVHALKCLEIHIL